MTAVSPNERLVAIDPDTKAYGWALFKTRELYACGVCNVGYCPWSALEFSAAWVCEMPEYRPPKGRTRVRVNDILWLARVAGQIVGSRPCDWVTPSRWKGQISKKAHHARMFEVLGDQEHEVLSKRTQGLTKDSLLDMNDAVCLGLWRLGRL